MSLLIPLDRIDENPYQPRTQYDEADLGTLATDIEENGVLQPPLARIIDADGKVWPLGGFYKSSKTISSYFEDHPDHRVQIAFGHRRLRAVRKIGWSRMPLQISVMNDERMDMMAWSENQKRADLTPLEQAQAIADRIERRGWTQAEAADALGIGRSTVANKLRLLKLGDEALQMLAGGEISERQALAALPMWSLEDWQQGLADEHEETDQRGDNTMYGMGLLRHAAKYGWSSERIRDAVKSTKRSMEMLRDARKEKRHGEERPLNKDAAEYHEEAPSVHEETPGVHASESGADAPEPEMMPEDEDFPVDERDLDLSSVTIARPAKSNPSEEPVDDGVSEFARELRGTDTAAWRTALREVAGIHCPDSDRWSHICQRLAEAVDERLSAAGDGQATAAPEKPSRLDELRVRKKAIFDRLRGHYEAATGSPAIVKTSEAEIRDSYARSTLDWAVEVALQEMDALIAETQDDQETAAFAEDVLAAQQRLTQASPTAEWPIPA